MKLFEITQGHQVLEFSDYLHDGRVAKKYIKDFETFGNELFKDGWTFKNEHNPKFYKQEQPVREDYPDDGWIIILPHLPKKMGSMHSWSIDMAYEGHDGERRRGHRAHYSIQDIQRDGLAKMMQDTMMAAYKR